MCIKSVAMLVNGLLALRYQGTAGMLLMIRALVANTRRDAKLLSDLRTRGLASSLSFHLAMRPGRFAGACFG